MTKISPKGKYNVAKVNGHCGPFATPDHENNVSISTVKAALFCALI
ncbi:hypothetical protein MTBBW1_2360020 [Desulfamplus magnetovallimortis]|uniref:Uncharacterized protein n=1 Tax=Desulfamplus magnetovallimortis TaxID=1246637 RepID=A0A1W1HDR6_9BACT|nr:hypothetical protein MTBBW1_2360020 [Desulfamplus magnetovallimortis]